MSNSYFQFKQFTIEHDRCAMKVGTDGVLLGAWAGSKITPQKILDIGTGTGLIAIMLAQRFEEAEIVGIDIDDDAVEQATDNATMCPFRDRIKIEKRDFAGASTMEMKYDLIISNPPFYEENTFGGDDKRDCARHTSSLPFPTLISKASKLLDDNGVFAVIIPSSAVNTFVAECAINSLYLLSRLDIKTTPKKAAKRAMLEFGKRIKDTKTATLCMRDLNNELSAEYKMLTGDFYLDK